MQICEDIGSYKEYCPRCYHNCAEETKYIRDCFESTFALVSRLDSECWEHSGIDCTNKAVDEICGVR